MKKLFIRTITGIVFVAILLGALWVSEYTYMVLLSLVLTGSLCEWTSLISPQCKISSMSKILLHITALLLLWSVFFAVSVPQLMFLLIVPVVGLLAFLISAIYSAQMSIKDLSMGVAGLIYPVALIVFLVLLAFTGETGLSDRYNPLWVTALFVLVWINDTGAYLVGMSIGKHRLFERLSPKKSWEGFFGGLVFATIAGYFLSAICGVTHLEGTVWGLLVSVFGTYGDLFESMLKRSAGVKDSGNILPGHGGLMDRFDSIFFAGPISVLYLWTVILT